MRWHGRESLARTVIAICASHQRAGPVGRGVRHHPRTGQRERPDQRRFDLFIMDDGFRVRRMLTTPRIGITKAAERPLRYVIAGNRFVSGPQCTRKVRQPKLASSSVLLCVLCGLSWRRSQPANVDEHRTTQTRLRHRRPRRDSQSDLSLEGCCLYWVPAFPSCGSAQSYSYGNRERLRRGFYVWSRAF